MGPAPAVAATRRAVRAVLERDARARVLVACSGGADSLALAAATAFAAARLGVGAGLVTVDHGLQPGSAGQARRVAAFGAELGLDPVEIVPVEVGTAGGPEAAARVARYAALEAAAAAFDARVLLGHTLDDQAETVLLGLGRGSGPRSIAGMRAVEGRFRRPFLGLRRAVTVEACRALGLDAWDDPHNADPGFRRVRLRREVLPLLDDVLGGGVAEALARTADLLRVDVDELDEQGAAAFHDLVTPGVAEPPSLPVGPAGELSPAVRTRVLRLWAAAVGAAPLAAEHVRALDALVTGWRGQGPVPLPGGVEASRTSGGPESSGRLEAHPTSRRSEVEG